MSQSKKMPRVVSASRNYGSARARRLGVISWEQVGRPWPPGAESLLDDPRKDEQLRLALVEKLLAGEGEQCEPATHPKFSERDFERTKLVVAAVAPHLAAEIELLMSFNYRRPRNGPGHPRDRITERAALAFELLRCCRVQRPARTIEAILAKMRRHVSEESIERDYRRRNRGRLVRVAGDFLSQIPPGDLHRQLLWRLYSLLSSSALTTPTADKPRRE